MDLETLPWLQHTTPRPNNSSCGANHVSTATPPAACSKGSSVVVGIKAAHDVAPVTKGPVSAIQLQQHQQHGQFVVDSRFTSNHSAAMPQQQGANRHVEAHLLRLAGHFAAHGQSEEEDAICDDSEDDFQPSAAPSSAPQTAWHGTGVRSPLTNPAGNLAALQHRHYQQHHMQHHMQQSMLVHSNQPSTAAQLTPQHLLQQQKQSNIRTSTPAAADPLLQQPCSSINHTGIVPAEADGAAEADWMPPKYRKPHQQKNQQAQLSLSASKQATKRHTGAPAAPTDAYTPAAAMGPGRPTGPGAVGCAAAIDALDLAGPDVTASAPWWMVLEDFVPVEVLVQEAVNPR